MTTTALTGLLRPISSSNSKANTRTKFTGFARVGTARAIGNRRVIQVHATSACSPENVRRTSLVGTPVVAAPKPPAPCALRTVAAFGSKKAPAKGRPPEVRTLTDFQRTYLDPLPSTAARSRTGGPERARRAHRRPVTFVEARIGRRSHRRAGNSARHVAAEGGVFRIKSRALPSLSRAKWQKNMTADQRVSRAVSRFVKTKKKKTTPRLTGASLLFSDRVHRARRSPSASGSSTPRAVTPARSALATRVSSRTAASRARRSERALGRHRSSERARNLISHIPEEALTDGIASDEARDVA